MLLRKGGRRKKGERWEFKEDELEIMVPRVLVQDVLNLWEAPTEAGKKSGNRKHTGEVRIYVRSDNMGMCEKRRNENGTRKMCKNGTRSE